MDKRLEGYRRGWKALDKKAIRVKKVEKRARGIDFNDAEALDRARVISERVIEEKERIDMESFESVMKILDEVADAKGKQKQEVLKANSDNEMLKKVLMYALNPFWTYGVAKVPERLDCKSEMSDDSVFDLLDEMRERKVTGDGARDMVQIVMNAESEAMSVIFGRILKKDLRVGASISTVNKAIPKLIPQFKCMLAHKYEEKRIKSWPQIVQPKLDGVRVLAFVDKFAGEVKFYSRSGKEFHTFDHLKESMLEVASGENVTTAVVFDGEVISGSFNKTVSEVRKKDVQATDAKFFAFDLMTKEDFSSDGPVEFGYVIRYAALKEMIGGRDKSFPVKLLPIKYVNSHEEIESYASVVMAKGLEGAIIKSPDGHYFKRRNHAWMKIKAEDSVDVKIVGAEEGTGKYEGMLGAIIIDHNGVDVNVGTGLSDEQRKDFWTSHAAGELVGRLCEVGYHEVTPDGSLRHPRFERFRDTLESGVKE